MGTLDQVKLLESKVINAIDFVKLLTEENDQLKEQLDSYQKRVDELEALIQGFREEQGRVEEGILSALNRLNQFEDAIDKSLAPSASAPSDAAPEDGAPGGEEPVEEVPASEENPEAEIMDAPVQEQQPLEGEAQPQ